MTDLLLALDGANDSPGSSSSTDNVLVGDGEEISLFDGEFRVEGGDRFHLRNHLRIARRRQFRIPEHGVGAGG